MVCREEACLKELHDARTMPFVTTRRVESIDRREFVAAAIVKESERARAKAKSPQLPHELRWHLCLWMRLLLFIIPKLLPLC